LDILCLEEKIVQQEAVYVLEATYEADFLWLFLRVSARTRTARVAGRSLKLKYATG